MINKFTLYFHSCINITTGSASMGLDGVGERGEERKVHKNPKKMRTEKLPELWMLQTPLPNTGSYRSTL